MEKYSEKIKAGLFYTMLLVLALWGVKNFNPSGFLNTKKTAANTFNTNQDFAISTLDLAAYGNIPLAHVKDISRDFSQLAKKGLYYQPWVQFSEPLFTSENVNIITDPTGLPIRKTINPNASEKFPVYKVYFFGGSCTFGYNVSDAETVCSYLSQILNAEAHKKNLPIHIEVENYGRAFYDPSQEMQLLIEVAKLGHRPSLALFLNGSNPGRLMDVPYCTEELVNRFYQIQFDDNQQMGWKETAKSFSEHLGFTKTEEAKENTGRISIDGGDESPNLTFIVNRFAQDKEIIKSVCKLYHLQPLFFSQPNPHYNYPIQFYKDSSLIEPESRKIWAEMYDSLFKKNSDIISLHSLFIEWNQKAIIDYSHYSPGFNEFVAQHMAAYINFDSLLAHPFYIDTTAATGKSRSIAQKIFDASQKKSQ